MNASKSLHLRSIAAASLLIFAASAATAQNAAESPPQQSGAAKPSTPSEGRKSAQKAESGDKSTADNKKTPAKAPSGYATESDARAHCKTAVVWVDNNHFNHYPGSREWGKKPGAFACE